VITDNAVRCKALHRVRRYVGLVPVDEPLQPARQMKLISKVKNYLLNVH
jgi:hypothetical protein